MLIDVTCENIIWDFSQEDFNWIEDPEERTRKADELAEDLPTEVPYDFDTSIPKERLDGFDLENLEEDLEFRDYISKLLEEDYGYVPFEFDLCVYIHEED